MKADSQQIGRALVTPITRARPTEGKGIAVSITTTIRSLPVQAMRPLGGPLAHYLAQAPDLPKEPEFGISGDTPMLRLPMVSLATLRYEAASVASMHPQTRGVVTEASIRLAHWRWQGRKRTAWYIAEELQEIYFSGRTAGHGRSLDPYRRVPRKGLDLIRAVDELGCGGIGWYCDVPSAVDWRRFQTVRLTDALAQIASSTAGHAGAVE